MNSAPLYGRRINKFINVLSSVMNNKEYSSIISWGLNGKTIEITNIPEFRNKVMLKHFKHSVLSNFIRQLNLYNFKKVSSKDSTILSYSNPLFYRDASLECLINLKRNKFTKKTMLSLREKYSSSDCLIQKIKETEAFIEKITEENEKLALNRKNQIKEVKDSISYMKDLEAFIYYTLNLSPKESLNRKVSKGFKKKLTSKFYSIVEEEALKKKHNLEKTTVNNSNVNVNDLLNRFEDNDSFGNLVYNQPLDEILNIDYDGFCNYSYEGNIYNSYDSKNLNLLSSNLFQEDDEVLYFKQYS